MIKMTDLKRRVLLTWTAILILVMLCAAVSEVLLPMTGKKQQKKGDLVVDCSNMDQGYIMVKVKKKTKKKGEDNSTRELCLVRK